MQHLVDVAAPFWAGEAAIVRAYLARPRTVADELHWLRAQAYKETRHLRDLPRPLREEYFATGRVAVHPDGPEAARKFREEMGHFRLLTDLIAGLTGTPVVLADLAPLAEDVKLQALRAPYRKGSALDQAIVDFTEGGGCAMYAVLSELDGGDFERHTAAAFRIIYKDEAIHGPTEIHTIAKLAAAPEDWERAERIVAAIGLQRLHMRNEMFLRPLSEARIAAIAAGDIEPWPMPVPL
jgi:hypothetical protein